VSVQVERKLSAIFAADIAGYSRLMGQDEVGALARLRGCREVMDQLIATHRGRIFNTAGDSVVADFASAVDAVQCAIAVQEALAKENAGQSEGEAMRFRIGIHVGDIIVQGDNLFGDAVNVAARLEAIAEPGGLCVSRVVRDQVRDKVNYAFEDLGDQQVKNIARPVRVYRVRDRAVPIAVPLPASTQALPLPDKPSIAVLPFANMSSDPEQEFFGDGIAEDIITALSKSRSLFVIARNSSFTYKGKAVAVKDVGRELGVRYVLEGSVRKAKNRVRVTAQLIEAESGGHLWAERYDRELADFFAVQDEITACVSAAIQPTVERSERERAAHKPPESLDAWECYHRGMWHFAKMEAAEHPKAMGFFRRATELDPGFAPGYAMLALAYRIETGAFRPDLRAENTARAIEYARQAIVIDPTDAKAHAVLAIAMTGSGHHAEGIAEADLAVDLDPNSVPAYTAQGFTRTYGGHPGEALEPLRTAMRLSPFDPLRFLWLIYLSRAQYWTQDYQAAIVTCRQLQHSYPNLPQAYAGLMASLGQIGQIDEAGAVMAEARERFGEPFRFWVSLPLNEIRELRPEDRAHLIDGFRKAGLPEE
jgi:adenylate cyclase